MVFILFIFFHFLLHTFSIYSLASRASCRTCSRVSLDLYLTYFVPHMPCALCASYHKWSCVSRASCLTCSCASRVLGALVPHVLVVPCVFSGCSCLELYVLLCFSSLTYFRCFMSNMLLCLVSLTLLVL